MLDLAAGNDGTSVDVTRRNEILQAANTVIASSGLRTSLQQIAESAGILAGSLYHHFDSKEAILIELIRRYHAELDRIGETALLRLDDPEAGPIPEQIFALAVSIAECAVRNSAALQLSFYEGPSDDPELKALTSRAPTTLNTAMLQALRAARWSGYLRPDIDLPTLADRVCQTMLHVGIDVIRNNAAPDRTATVLCRILFDGLATRRRDDTELDESSAFAAADEVVRTWASESAADPDDRAAHVRAVAREEFGRKGYEFTTVRDIAAAAGMGTGTVYRLIGSKDELLGSIMLSFGDKLAAGWTSVLQSDSTPIEKIDALSWVNISALDQFSDEFRIQLAWMRQTPPGATDPAWSFGTRVRQMKHLLAEGVRSGEIRIESPSSDMLARCVIGVQWIPENILLQVGRRAALVHARDTVVRGVAERADG
ncbi:TetR/AcrR family transcriptional regulator [Aldersonia sp. NBC_00410]|uniref:TetR/AcrR family transcriptional regulator n=1 Tax=Aldersonia sp. NBC_00410 TaxID=2975954 RepID=UPI00225037E3|nr:TetR/AcrR family transcriptional regulator [Aldersonia sp. NBC_00410]MCX5044303.1 TetR/AcrR family transcriptional regulator [Aldersonia sp. NBC_00410]